MIRLPLEHPLKIAALLLATPIVAPIR